MFLRFEINLNMKAKKIDKDKKLEKLLYIVLEKYPELKGYTFYIRYRSLSDAYAQCVLISTRKVDIEVDIDLKDENDTLKIAAIASELSHVLKANILSLIPFDFGNFLEGFIYEISTTYRKYDEKQTDLETVRRGFGEELLELLKYDDEDTTDLKDESEGLSKTELEAILKHSARKIKKEKTKISL